MKKIVMGSCNSWSRDRWFLNFLLLIATLILELERAPIFRPMSCKRFNDDLNFVMITRFCLEARKLSPPETFFLY